MSSNDVLSAARRTEQVWWEQICEWESLEYGVAFTCRRYPSLADAQQLRDAWLADVDGPEAFRRAEAWYAERGLTCSLWTPASGQDDGQIESLMTMLGWRRENIVALGLSDVEHSPSETELDGVRILPARAMPRAYRAFLDSIHDRHEAARDAAFDRLDDASYEVLLAVRDGAAVGRIGYHEVGDFARLRDFSISSDVADDAIRRLLVAHFVLRARRLSPRVIVACLLESATSEIEFLNNCGFTDAGRLMQFRRPA